MSDIKDVMIETADKICKKDEPCLCKKFIAEMIGTSCLTLVACGAAAKSNGDAAEIAIAFGMTIVAMAYSIGNVSGCHINPAVSLCMLVRKKMKFSEFLTYCAAQLAGAFLGSTLLGIIFRSFKSLCTNSIQKALMNGNNQIDGCSYAIAVLVEILLTFFFLMAINGATDSKYNDGKNAGLIIGGALMLCVCAGLNLTGCSVNPFRSLAPAVLEAFAGNCVALNQVWIFLVGPFTGGALAGIVYGLIA